MTFAEKMQNTPLIGKWIKNKVKGGMSMDAALDVLQSRIEKLMSAVAEDGKVNQKAAFELQAAADQIIPKLMFIEALYGAVESELAALPQDDLRRMVLESRVLFSLSRNEQDLRAMRAGFKSIAITKQQIANNSVKLAQTADSAINVALPIYRASVAATISMAGQTQLANSTERLSDSTGQRLRDNAVALAAQTERLQKNALRAPINQEMQKQALTIQMNMITQTLAFERAKLPEIRKAIASQKEDEKKISQAMYSLNAGSSANSTKALGSGQK